MKHNMKTNGQKPRKPMTHRLKCDAWAYDATKANDKPFEVRPFDRDFRVYDYIVLKRQTDDRTMLTGETSRYLITSILEGGQYGIEPGYCVLGIKPVNPIDYILDFIKWLKPGLK